MAQKPGIPKGTRDFSPEQTAKRNYIFDTLKAIFDKYAYSPLETPAMENLSTLMGKYGEEGDKLLFKILNSGDYAAKVPAEMLAQPNSVKLTPKISEKGLRYDLTVPFARYVVQHRNEINFPFKRWQIQPVWRADKPQKGRYREFFQCDVDVVGSNSLLNEVELVQIVDEGFKALKINVLVKLNNRKILSGIAEIIDEADRITDITVAIDKLEKIGLEKVNQELLNKGIPQSKIDILQPIIQLEGSNNEKLGKLKSVLGASEIGLKGIDETQLVLDTLSRLNITAEIELDLTLARGLNYYTGAIIEVKAKDAAMGSICGGGRYDDLTGIFGLKDVSGVGVSFGADRIYDVMDQLELFPNETGNGPKLLFVHFGQAEQAYCLPLLQAVREAGFKAEMYPDSVKMKKQMTYANNRKVAYVAIVGESEMAQNSVMLKNMATGEQELISTKQLVEKLG